MFERSEQDARDERQANGEKTASGQGGNVIVCREEFSFFLFQMGRKYGVRHPHPNNLGGQA